MNKENYKGFLATLLCILLLCLDVAAQKTKVSSDDLLKRAIRETNVNKNYKEAIRLAKQGLAISPNYTDIQLLLGRLYLMEGQVQEGTVLLEKVLQKDPKNKDAYNYLINGYATQKDYAQASDYAAQYLEQYPEDEEMQLKNVEFTRQQGDLKAAYALSDSLMKANPEFRKIRTVNNDLLVLSRQNRIGLGYSLTAFDQQGRKPWNIYSVSYMRSEKYGSLIGRVSYADRKISDGYQVEVEAYPIHGKSYSFINLSYSNSRVFPQTRFSYSFFPYAKNGWEPEIGVRYQMNEDNFFSYVGGIGKYFSSYWLGFKAFATQDRSDIVGSYTLSGRYYLGESVDDYVTAVAGYGFFPDDRGRNFEIANRISMQTTRLTLGYQRTLWKRNILGLFGTWNNFKYDANSRRNEYDVAVSFQHKF